MIAYALLEGMVPHFSDPNGQASANRLLYVICSRARKSLHLIAEQGRFNGIGEEYVATMNPVRVHICVRLSPVACGIAGTRAG